MLSLIEIMSYIFRYRNNCKMKGRRKSSTVKLDLYAKIVFKTILQHQDSNTGLMSDNENGHAWIRDNVYSILSVWALSLAYKKYR